MTWFFGKNKDKEEPSKELPIADKNAPHSQTKSQNPPKEQKLKQTSSIPKALLDARLKQTENISQTALGNLPATVSPIPKPTEGLQKTKSIEEIGAKLATPAEVGTSEAKVPPSDIVLSIPQNLKKAGENSKVSGKLKQTVAIPRAALAAKFKPAEDRAKPSSLIPSAKSASPTSTPQTTPSPKLVATAESLKKAKVSKSKIQMLYCPICEEKMESKTYGNFSVYSCDVCGGYWCPNNTLQILAMSPQAELSRILTAKMKVLAGVKLEAELEVITPHQCPSCKNNLLMRHYKKVIGVGMESCRQHCGTFIEKNVLEKIQILNRLG